MQRNIQDNKKKRDIKSNKMERPVQKRCHKTYKAIRYLKRHSTLIQDNKM